MKKIALIAVLLPIAALFACTADRDNPYDPKGSGFMARTVSFDSRGGSGVSVQTVGYNRCAADPGVPARTGYTFDGWFRDTACTQQWNFTSDTVTADTTLYAGWIPIQYDISFDSQGGSAVDALVVNYDDYVTEPGEPVRTGYTFTGWFREPGCFNEWRFAIDTVTGDATLYAGWTLNQYTLTYTAGAGGSISGVSPQTVNHGASGTAVSAVPDTGYHFSQWSDGSSANPRTDTNVTAGISVIAQFAINQYTVSFNSQGGSAVDAQTVDHGDLVSEPSDPVRTGYNFSGWYRESGCATPWLFMVDVVTGATTLYAGWTIIQYTLTYTAGAGGSISGTSPQTVNHGASGTAVSAVPNTGYYFTQWSDGSTANPRTDTNVTAGISVIAQFALIQCTLTYTAGAGGTISGISPQTVSYGSDGTAVEAVPNTGYYFTQWSDASTVNPRTDTSVTSDISVSAQFAIYTYTLTYTAGTGGSISGTSPQTVNYGTSGTAVTAVPDTGYSFTQWSDGSTANPRTDAAVTSNVSVSAAFTANRDITDFRFTSALNSGHGVTSDCAGVIVGTGIAVTVPYGADISELIATFTTTGQSVSVEGVTQTSGVTDNDFTSPVIYRVTGVDSTTKDYTVSVTVAPNTAKDITDFRFTSALNNGYGVQWNCIGIFSGTSITILVPHDTDRSGLIATFTTTGQTVSVGATPQESGVTHNNFSSPVTYRVTAEDGSTKNYTVTVNVAASDTGAFWTQRTLPSSSYYWNSVCYANGVFIIIGGGSYSTSAALVSSNGVDWTLRTIGFNSLWNSITYGNGRFVAVGRNSSNSAVSTDNGASWTQGTLPASQSWYSVAFGNGRFVAVAWGSSTAAYSTDGITWTATTLPGASNLCWTSVTCGNGRFVAVNAYDNTAAYSDDGITWASMPLTIVRDAWSVMYGNGVFVATGDSNLGAVSTDGVNWSQVTLPSYGSWRAGTFGDGTFVILCGSTYRMAVSTDGVNWTQSSLPTYGGNPWTSAAYGGGVFVTFIWGSDILATSP